MSYYFDNNVAFSPVEILSSHFLGTLGIFLEMLSSGYILNKIKKRNRDSAYKYMNKNQFFAKTLRHNSLLFNDDTEIFGINPSCG